MKCRLIALALSLSTASLAFAAEPVATLAVQDGVVMVNAGDEFVTATDAQALLPGERVMVMEGAAAELQFADGCRLSVEPGSMLVVPEQSTCAGAVAAVQSVPPSYAQAVGGRRGANSGGWLIGGITALAIVGVMSMDEEFDVPVSP